MSRRPTVAATGPRRASLGQSRGPRERRGEARGAVAGELDAEKRNTRADALADRQIGAHRVSHVVEFDGADIGTDDVGDRHRDIVANLERVPAAVLVSEHDRCDDLTEDLADERPEGRRDSTELTAHEPAQP